MGVKASICVYIWGGIYWGYRGIMEEKMGTIGVIGYVSGYLLGLYSGYIGIMDNKMEATETIVVI